jgi:FAD binding domain
VFSDQAHGHRRFCPMIQAAPPAGGWAFKSHRVRIGFSHPALRPSNLRACCKRSGSRPAAAKSGDAESRFNRAWGTAEPPKQQPFGTAVVVGAGIAGLMTALTLAQFGMDVHVRLSVVASGLPSCCAASSCTHPNCDRRVSPSGRCVSHCSSKRAQSCRTGRHAAQHETPCTHMVAQDSRSVLLVSCNRTIVSCCVLHLSIMFAPGRCFR